MRSTVATAARRGIRRVLPPSLVSSIKTCREDVRLWPVRLAWRESASSGYLGRQELEMLQARYPFRTGYRYDAASLAARGEERAQELLRLPGCGTAESFLEVGCSDGMVSATLQRAGKRTTAVDLVDKGFDPRARAAGTTLREMDATNLAFDDGVFDVAFSYNAFEHFAEPGRVLDEIIRVVRPGGSIYLSFGPLYDSPWGAHAYRSITVPYCQFLFPLDLMNEVAVAAGRNPLRPGHVNGWPTDRYRALWNSVGDRVIRRHYVELRDLSSLDVLKSYPSCFKARSPRVSAFLVSHMTVLFERRAPQRDSLTRARSR